MTLATDLIAVLLIGAVFVVAVGTLAGFAGLADGWLEHNDQRLLRGVGIGFLVLGVVAAGSVVVNAI